MTVLARTWRPKQFEDYLGQTHVTDSLVHALNNNRLHHAYLFSGTRGIGKTSIARIFSKSISCKQGISATPCQTCDNCQAIDNGTYIDLIEVDAASNTKVEDTKELLEHAKFVPHTGKFKVFIIDEVHMLSNHSFNALLKTLEEPPAHIKFLLATTEPNKIPITILSRCLHFKLLPINYSVIAQHLAKILTAENITFDVDAIENIAKNSDGSVRDALSATDQLIALGSGKVSNLAVATLLGLSEPKLVLSLMQNILARNKAQVLSIIEDMDSQGLCLKKVLWQLMELLHELQKALFLDTTPEWVAIESWTKLSKTVRKEQTHFWYQMLTFGVRDFDFAPNQLIATNMTLMRMLDFTDKPTKAETNNILASIKVTGMTKAIVDNLEIIEQTPQQLTLKLAADKKALLTPVQVQKIKEAIKNAGYSAEVVIQCNPKATTKLSQAFNGKVISTGKGD